MTAPGDPSRGEPVQLNHSTIRIEATAAASPSTEQIQSSTDEDPPTTSTTDAPDEELGYDSPTLQRFLSRLRQRYIRSRTAEIRAQFEQTILVVLTLNIIYTYYLDHTLLVFVIRTSQLLYLPYAHESSQKRTTMSILVTSLLVLVIHNVLFGDPSQINEMLFINFIGPEPKSLVKLIAVDILVILLQAMLLQVRWESAVLKPISILPVPVSQSLPSSESEAT